MGVFARFRRRSSGGPEEPNAVAASGSAQTDASSSADDVEIPRQQSPGEAAERDGDEAPAQNSHTER